MMPDSEKGQSLVQTGSDHMNLFKTAVESENERNPGTFVFQ